ncbi:DUF3996 domain-containing protein [Borrelia anserina]|uniref:DUF3996 domain-containing protein n=1 Tax=Borrelia anserina BA2 TaxID=1313293 RepID=W5SMK8_BORAN|nr:DUF3996 domain-containing protein [Borrelia anserina]AHH08379.1 Hypothetical protein BAN_0074800 [Borrelia anserina BA2]
MEKKAKKIVILLLIFNLYYSAFSQSNNAYSIECKKKDDGTICITNDKPTSEKPKPTSEKLKPTSEKPKPTSEKPKPTSEKPKPTSEKPKQHITKKNHYAIKSIKNPFSFAVGTGTGNPLINLLISIPYIDIDLGYGSFLYFSSANFKPYNLIAVDLTFRQQIGTSLIIGGGFGIGIDWSQANLIPPGAQQPSPYNRIGIVARLPLSIEYKVAKNLSLGFKTYPTIGPTILLTEPKIIFEGLRFKFFAIGFIRVFI